MASTNIISKLSRAIAAYLVSSGAVPDEHSHHIFSRKERKIDTAPIASVLPQVGQRDPAITGDDRFPVNISIRGSASPRSQSEHEELRRVEFDAQVGKVRDALMQADADDANSLKATARLINAAAYAKAAEDSEYNADLDDFTILAWYDGVIGPGKADEENCDWEIVLQFEAVCCESKLEGYTPEE